MQHPSEVGVPLGWGSELPMHVVVLAEPVLGVEERVGYDVVGAEVGMEVSSECVGMLVPEVAFKDANGQVHPRTPPRRRVGLLRVVGDRRADGCAVLLASFGWLTAVITGRTFGRVRKKSELDSRIPLVASGTLAREFREVPQMERPSRNPPHSPTRTISG